MDTRQEATEAEPQRQPWLAGKVALVTGAASGIGPAAARRFAEEGAAVALVDRDAAGLHRVAELIAAAGGRSLVVTADIASAADNSRMVAEARRVFGRLDIAFLNAGILGPMGGFASLTAEAFDTVLRTNLYGCFHALKALFDAIADDGAIVVTASTAGLAGLPDAPAYSTAKHGIIGLVQSSAAAFAARNVRINAICPGGVATPMAGAAQSDNLVAPEVLRMPPFGGMSSAQHVAELALFLASSRSSAMTGASIAIDVGWTAGLPPAG